MEELQNCIITKSGNFSLLWKKHTSEENMSLGKQSGEKTDTEKSSSHNCP